MMALKSISSSALNCLLNLQNILDSWYKCQWNFLIFETSCIFYFLCYFSSFFTDTDVIYWCIYTEQPTGSHHAGYGVSSPLPGLFLTYATLFTERWWPIAVPLQTLYCHYGKINFHLQSETLAIWCIWCLQQVTIPICHIYHVEI